MSIFGQHRNQAGSQGSVSLTGSAMAGATLTTSAGKLTSNINSLRVNSLKQLNLWAEQKLEPPFHSYTVTECPEDSLALAVCYHRLTSLRLGAAAGTEMTNMLSPAVASQVTTVDRDLASKIRQYYQERIVLWRLAGAEFTEFRRKLEDYTRSDGTLVREGQHGMLYRLPQFYEYDTALDTILENLMPLSEQQCQSVKTGKVTLTSLRALDRVIKRGKFTDYWCHDSNHNAYRISVEQSNALRKVFERYVFETSQPFTVSGLFEPRDSGTSRTFFAVRKWQFE
jgi:hypothetical protein